MRIHSLTIAAIAASPLIADASQIRPPQELCEMEKPAQVRDIKPKAIKRVKKIPIKKAAKTLIRVHPKTLIKNA